MSPLQVVGIAGMVMFLMVLLHCCFQLVYFLRAKEFKNRTYESIKLRFHVVFGISASLESIYSLSLYTADDITEWGYTCHLIGLYLNLLAFLLVIYLWNHVLASQNLLRVRMRFYYAFMVSNLISVVVEVSLSLYYHENDGSIKSIDSIAANILYILSLLVTCLMLLVAGNRIKNKLNPDGDNRKNRSMRNLLRKINVCLIVFIASYSLKIYFVSRWTIVWIITGEEPGFTQFSDFSWYLLTYWIPTLAPGIIFLYIMRYRSSTINILKESLTCIMPSDQVYNYDVEDGIGNEKQPKSPTRSISNTSTCSASSELPQNDIFVNRMTFFSKDGNDMVLKDMQ